MLKRTLKISERRCCYQGDKRTHSADFMFKVKLTTWLTVWVIQVKSEDLPFPAKEIGKMANKIKKSKRDDGSTNLTTLLSVVYFKASAAQIFLSKLQLKRKISSF